MGEKTMVQWFVGGIGRVLIGAVVAGACAWVVAAEAADASAATAPAAKRFYYGRVMTAEGKAVAGARVFLVESDGWTPEGNTVGTATADAEGRFRMPTTRDAGAGVLVQAEGFPLTIGMLSLGTTEQEPNEIEMAQPAEVRVRFVDPDGKPVAGVQVAPVMLLNKRGYSYADLPRELRDGLAQRTDANGACVFGGMPDGCMVRLDVRDDGWAQGSKSMSAVAGEAKPTVLALQPAGEVRGRVVVAKDGTPVAGVRIGAQATNANRAGGGGSAITDAQGNYHLKRMNPGEYNLALDLPGELRQQYTAAAREQVKVEARQTLAGQDFALIPGGFVTGKAYVEGTGEPVAGTHIGVYGPAHPKSSAWVQGMPTAKDGTFSFRVPPGEQYVYLMSQSPLGLVSKDGRGMRNVKAKEGETVKMDFVFRRVTAAAMRGRVVDGDGNPVAGAQVMVEPGGAASMEGGGVETDAQGEFEVAGIPDGSRVSAMRGRSVTEQAVVIGKGNRNLTLVIKPLRLASARVVVRTEDGKPAAGVKVSLMETHGRFGTTIEEQTADAEGTVVVRKLYASNQYSVQASGNGFGAAAATVNLKAGEEVEVKVVVPRAESFVAGEVDDDEGTPVAGIEVEFNSSKSGYRTVKTDENGRFRFGDVVAGDRPIVYVRQGNKSIQAENVTAGKEDVVIIVPKEGKK